MLLNQIETLLFKGLLESEIEHGEELLRDMENKPFEKVNHATYGMIGLKVAALKSIMAKIDQSLKDFE